jgi:hypothetical protein
MGVCELDQIISRQGPLTDLLTREWPFWLLRRKVFRPTKLLLASVRPRSVKLFTMCTLFAVLIVGCISYNLPMLSREVPRKKKTAQKRVSTRDRWLLMSIGWTQHEKGITREKLRTYRTSVRQRL